MTTEVDHYKRVLDIFANDEIDYKKIASLLAKECPEAFVALHEKCSGKLIYTNAEFESAMKLYELKMKALAHINAGSRVEAIKHVRTETGYGLQEAKDFCDHLSDEARIGIIPQKPKPVWPPLRELIAGDATVADKNVPKTSEEIW